MQDFTTGSALGGGALIGLAASLLLLANGKVAGISGIVFGLLVRRSGDVAWRALFVAGLLVAGLVAGALAPAQIAESPRGLVALGISGALVGAGTRLAEGCTSGHGVCGVSRLSVRSFVATATFVLVGVITVLLTRVFEALP